ncbi:hypothetical protein ACFZBE_23760 [Streptomyces sp. NPDC008061]|uniref:hypothetical protein n=1 Tax=Streptomyces sp. NPDC008061 TaxID=3364805 RepID=UPI0036E80CA5
MIARTSLDVAPHNRDRDRRGAAGRADDRDPRRGGDALPHPFARGLTGQGFTRCDPPKAAAQGTADPIH